MSHGSCTCALRKNVACSVLPAMHPSVPRPCLETCALPKLRQATTEDLQRMARALEGQAEGALDVDGRVAAKRLSSAIAQLLAQNAGAGICSRPCALPAGSCYVPGTSLAAVPAAGCALPWPRTLCRFAPGGAELNDWARTLEETARAGPPGLDRAGRAAACRLSSAVAQLVQQNRNVYEDQASSSLLSSLDEDTLAMVLAAATFREPDSLIPSGFYFNPDLHRALRLTCRRVDMSLRSQRYKDEVARAPVGRVTLREAHEQVSAPPAHRHLAPDLLILHSPAGVDVRRPRGNLHYPLRAELTELVAHQVGVAPQRMRQRQQRPYQLHLLWC